MERWQAIVAKFREDHKDLLEELAPGVRGFTFEGRRKRGLYFSYVEAVHPGNGDVGRWLDRLPTDRRVVVTSVLNPKLAGMLARRRFSESQEWSFELDRAFDTWERDPNAPTLE